MKFEDIFKEAGTYKAESFIKGYCYEVDTDGFLYGLQYKSKNDVNPQKENAVVYRGLFNKNFVKVFNRNQLFEENSCTSK